MTGTWKLTVGGSTFGDYTDIIEPAGVSGGPTILTIQGYGAAQPLFLPVGNARQVRRFTMTRQHSSNADAVTWYQTAIATWAGVATVVIAHTDYSGVESTWTLAGANVEIAIDPPIGLTTTTHITITAA